jgi:hypothetical protein
MRVCLAKGCASYDAPVGAVARLGNGESCVNVTLDAAGGAVGLHWVEQDGPTARSRTASEAVEALRGLQAVARESRPPSGAAEGKPAGVPRWVWRQALQLLGDGFYAPREPAPIGRSAVDRAFGVHGPAL